MPYLSGGIKDIFKADTWKITSETVNDISRGFRDIRDVAIQALPAVMPELAPFAQIAQQYISSGATPQQAYEAAYAQTIQPGIYAQYPQYQPAPVQSPVNSFAAGIPTEYLLIGAFVLLLILLR